MRKVLAVLTVLAAALVVAPATPATSAPDGDANERRTQTDRRGTPATYRQRVVALTNNRRQNHGCSNLRRNDALDRAAQAHTGKMANRNTLSHQLPGEPSLGVRVRRAGYNWSLVGENIAAGWATPRAVVRGWMNSRPHRRNILNCRYRHIGVGYAVSDRGVPFWTQDFGRR